MWGGQEVRGVWFRGGSVIFHFDIGYDIFDGIYEFCKI